MPSSSETSTLRKSVLDGLDAAGKAELHREALSTADRQPSYDALAHLAKLEGIAEAGLGQPLATRTANGGEVVVHEEEMKFEAPGLYDALTAPPTVLQAVASRDRMDGLAEADAMALGVDLAESVDAENSLEKMLAHQIAASHRLAMRFMGMSHDELQGYKTCGRLERSVEASRCASSASRLMAACGAAALVLQRLQESRAEQKTTSRVSVNIMSITKETQK